MKSFKSAFVSLSASLLVGALALGCGDGGAKPDASGSPSGSMSSKPSSSSKPTSMGSSKPAASSAGMDAPATPSTASGSSEAIKYMPKTCTTARVYVNLGKLFAGDVGKSLEDMGNTLLASQTGADAEKGKKVEAALKEGGIRATSVKELAICAGKGDDDAVAVVTFDASAVKGAVADTIAKAMEASEGKAPTKATEDGVTYLMGDKGHVFGFVTPTIMVIGKKDAVKAVAKGGDGAADYADAPSNVIWVSVDKDGKKINATIKDNAPNYDVKVSMSPPKEMGPDAAAAAKAITAEIEKVKAGLAKTPFKDAQPLLDSAKCEAAGENVVITTSFPQALVAQLLKAASDPKALGALMSGKMH